MKAAVIFAASSILCGSVAAQEAVTTRRIVDVQFPSDYTGAAAPVPDDRLDQVNGTLMQVKIPRNFLDFRTFSFVGEELSYTASIRMNSAKVSITGTRIATDAADDTAPEGAVQSSIGERSASASKVENGGAYEVTVECVTETDPKCTDDIFVIGQLAELLFVGGGTGQPTPISGSAAPLPPGTPFDKDFKFDPPGKLAPNSGSGVTSTTIYAPSIRFPVEKGPAYLNSQVYGIGGTFGPRGGWTDKRNYAYPWRDNFCEKRSRKTPACPSGTGHQGVDIRPADHRDVAHWAVAVEDGRVSNIGVYSVTILGASGTQYRYLHMKMNRLAVKQGDKVKWGQELGLISHDFGGTPTPVHLHFEMLQNVNGKGFKHVPPYSSLVRAYQQGA
ncbi:M23 family metallopeptidase [Rhizobium ruizarguesonis]|uniref:M23 family metallopeptidase n=1 Tax=Rhizobium ruizarguesonis TaxID=2081791 RepID=UPI0010300611|nr:M23 family metallopeptidase [Rhizobium ruizarguesonis]TBB60667.1 M23 family metallopeptidase [Rhizobium ruizarguesonis]